MGQPLSEDGYTYSPDLTAVAAIAALEGVDAEAVAAQASASVLAEDFQSHFESALGTTADPADRLAEILYGLLRQGLPSTGALLLSQPVARLEDALNAAIEAEQVKSDLSDQVSTIAAALRDTLAWLAAEDGEAPLWRLLEETSLTDTEKRTFLLAWLGRDKAETGDETDDETDGVAAFWTRLTDGTLASFTDAQVDELRAVIGLATIAGDDVDLVICLLGDDITEAADLVGWSASDWEDRLNTYVEDGYATPWTGTEVDEVTGVETETSLSVAEYAAHLAKQVEAAFPASRLLAAITARGLASVPDTFDFETGAARDPAAGVSDDAVASVEGLQRAFCASPDEDRAEIVLKLTDAGYNSARRVARLGRRAFAARHANTFSLDGDADTSSGATRARSIWRQARAQSAQAQALHALFSPDFVGARPAAVPAVSTTKLDALDDSATAGQARLQLYFNDVFGSRRSSTRRSALSAFSPAAYMVDLLAWLQTCENSDGKSAYSVLVERRPDIKSVQLSEANTTRTLPAIDLVLEILEAAMPDSTSMVAAATTGAPEDLLAYPEHLEGYAYTTLLSAALPPHLPFHLWQEQGRIYLEHLDVARHELMRQLQGEGGPTDAEIAAETLGLCPAAWTLVAAAAEEGKEELRWGYDDPTTGWTEGYRRARALMEALGVDYPTLRDLVGADFVDPDGVASLDDDDDEDGPLLTVSDGAESTMAALLDRLQRFARLRAALPWSVAELDHAITVAVAMTGEGSLGAQSLVFLADLLRLSSALDVPGPRLLGLWGALDIRAPRKTPELPSPYQAIFASRALPQKEENPLDWDVTEGKLTEPEEEYEGEPEEDIAARATLGGNLEAIRAALDLTEAERLALIREPDTDDSEEAPPYRALRPAAFGTSDTRTLENLAQLHGLVTLARALKLSMVELAALRNTLDANPLDGPDSAWDFARELRRLRESGVSVDELMYILHGESYARDRVGIRDDDLSERIDALLEAVQLAREEWEALVAQTESTAGSGGTNLARMRLALGLALAAEEVDTLVTRLSQVTLSVDDESEIRAALADLVTNSTLNDLDDEAPEARYKLIADDLLPVLLRDRLERLATERIADLIGLPYEQAEALVEEDGEILDTLLDDALYAEEVDIAAQEELLEDASARLVRLHRYALLASRLKLDREELSWLLNHTGEFGLLGLTTLDTDEANLDDGAGRTSGQARYQAWRNTLDLFALGRLVPGKEPGRVDLLEALVEDLEAADSDSDAAGSDVDLPVTFFGALHARAGWSTEVMADLATHLGMNSASFADLEQLGDWLDALRTTQRLGVTATQAVALAARELDEDSALIAVHAVRARLGEVGWRQAGRPLRDRLRTRQRDALVAYLLNENGLDRPMDLSKQLLVDVEVGTQPLTSRLVAATSAVQAFVLRALLNLEPEVQLSREEAEQWEWMSRYRLWEANRKVFFYPENWLEPELRDDKSELFETLESDLLQGELTDVMVERAFERYLEGLAAVSNLLVLAHYHEQEDDDDGTVDILHVFARTRSNPPVYYYRQWVDQSRWTAWEKLDIGVEGDHLIPVVFNRRLMLFWATFVAQTDEAGENKWWEIHFGRSERREDQWSPKVMLERTLSTYAAEGNYNSGDLDEGEASDDQDWPMKDKKRSYTFRTWFDDDDLVIACYYRNRAYYRNELDQYYCKDGAEVGRLVFAPGRVRPEVLNQGSRLWPIYPAGMISRANLYSASDETMGAISGLYLATMQEVRYANDYVTDVAYGTERAVKVLGTVSAPFSLTPPPAQRHFMGQVPFFFHDRLRSYYVVPEEMTSAAALKRGLSTGALNPGRLASFAPSKSRQAAVKAIHTELLTTAETALITAVDTMSIDGLTTAYFSTLATSSTYAGTFADVLVASTSTYASPSAITSKISSKVVSGMTAMRGLGPTATASGVSSALEISAPVAEMTAQILAGPTLAMQNLLYRIEDDYTYRFESFSHPYAWRLLRTLRREGVFGVLRPDEDGQDSELCRQQLADDDYFEDNYEPAADRVVTPYPADEIDFSATGAYSAYNWELFFHAPLLIAERLRREQKFAEARQWYHCIFDPTDRSSTDASDTSRYWKVKPLYESRLAGVDTLLGLYGDDSGTVAHTQRQIEAQLAVWREDPFDPHAIARLRVTAYQKAVVMKYVDNIIDWADHLFRQDTLESVNEATTLYLLAAELLGDRPILAADEEPETDPPTVQDMLDELEDADGTAALSDPLVRAENLLPRTLRAASLSEKVSLPLSTLPTAFSVPHNAHLLSYWTKVEDRLFKIRNSQNIEGMIRTLPLFAPPIDPALLVRARAMGVDLSSAIAEMEAPLPPYKFQSVLQQAQALAGTVKALGGALLAALEKRDGEALSLLRGGQEQALLKAVREVKEKAVGEAEATIAATKYTRDTIMARETYYSDLIDTGLLPEESAVDVAVSTASIQEIAAGREFGLAEQYSWLPQVTLKVGSPDASWGSLQWSNLFQAQGNQLMREAARLRSTADLSSRSAINIRREQEWSHMHEQAKKEVQQINKQILAAEIRKAIAERDLKNHELQMEHAETVDTFMRSKFTSQQLYDWMMTQLSGLYFQSYRLAVDMARKAERCFRYELGQASAAYIQYGHWDSLRKGLLAGERLQLDLDRMSAAWTEQHRRENEIAKHVSLALLDPEELQKLRLGGSCAIELPEELFDQDFPGHYFRRIRSVSVTIPCVTGPYGGLNATLTLVSSRVRTSTSLEGGYAESASGQDSRFQYLYGAQSVALSSGQNDAGVFELSLQDPRYLPFEGAGAVSTWKLELEGAVQLFDWQSISDVVLHLRYTSRSSATLKTDATAYVRSVWADAAAEGLVLGLSARTDFSDAWYRFLHPSDDATEAKLEIAIAQTRFPRPLQGATLAIYKVELIQVTPTSEEVSGLVSSLTYGETDLGSPSWDSRVYEAPAATLTPESALDAGGTLTLSAATGVASEDNLTDLIVLIHYTAEFSD